WQHLRAHIEDGSCDRLGGESLTKHPPCNPDAQVGPGSERSQPGGRHLCILPPVAVDQHCGTTRGDTSQTEGSAQQAPTTRPGGHSTGGDNNSSTGQGPRKAREARQPLERKPTPSSTTPDPARGSTSGPQGRQGIRAFCSPRPVLDHPGDVCHLTGMAQQTGGGSGHRAVTIAHPVASLSDQRADAKGSKDGGNLGGSGQAQGGGLAVAHRRVALHEVLSQDKKADPQQGEGQHGSLRGHQTSDLSADSDAGRHHSQVLQHSTVETVGTHRGPQAPSGLLAGSGVAGGKVVGGSRSLLHTVWPGSVAADRPLGQTRNAAEDCSGQKGGQPPSRPL
ncbi:hypothetical protein AK812_SmicGene46484, partial [Symbiodinium microadriaticum]